MCKLESTIVLKIKITYTPLEYAKKGFGDKKMMYEQENCEEILNNTMFCTEWKNIECLNVKTQNCSEHRKTCEHVSPIMLNDVHFLV